MLLLRRLFVVSAVVPAGLLAWLHRLGRACHLIYILVVPSRMFLCRSAILNAAGNR
jgi:hypothetical protein